MTQIHQRNICVHVCHSSPLLDTGHKCAVLAGPYVNKAAGVNC